MKEGLETEFFQAGVLQKRHKQGIAILRDEIAQQVGRGKLVQMALDAIQVVAPARLFCDRQELKRKVPENVLPLEDIYDLLDPR